MGNTARQAIIDIGSNTVRLVIYGGSPRAPVVLYDDKIAAGLGRGVVARRKLDRRSTSLALATLTRFAALLRLVRPQRLTVVATAAVRDAANGAAFVAQVRALGLPAVILSGEEEAKASALGVIGAHPGAHGMVADLGGGSLELARIKGEAVRECVSFPLGVMPVAKIRSGGRGRLRKAVKEAVGPLRWMNKVEGRRLYLVGGAWRALFRVNAHLTGGNLEAAISADKARALKAVVRDMGVRRLAAIPGVSSARAAQLPHASALLSALVAETGVADVQVSLTGLREGLLMQEG